MKKLLLFAMIATSGTFLNSPASAEKPMPGLRMPTHVKALLDRMAASHETGNVARIIQRRKAELLSGRYDAGASLRKVTSMQVPLLLGEYSNTTARYSRQEFHNQIFENNPTGTMVDYYREVSSGQLALQGQTIGWEKTPGTQAYYVDGNYGLTGGGARFARELVAAADNAVDFSQFDSDGDGYADVVMIVHTGPGAETQPASSRDNIWSHRWSFNSASYFYPNMMPNGEYVTNDPRPGHPGQYIKINDYIIQPEQKSAYNSGLIDIGVFCHEFGHALGLPDLYDTDYSSAGIGNWCLMASGSYGGNGRQPESPAHMSAWCKEELGWVTPIDIQADTRGLRIPPVFERQDAVYRVWRNGVAGSEYFLLENRQRQGYDGSLINSGLLIWHIDQNVIKANRNSNRVNSNENRKGIDLEEADGQAHMDSYANRGDAGDPFPGTANATLFSGSSNPSSLDYSGQATNVEVSSISVDGSDIVADVILGIESGGDTETPVLTVDPGEVEVGSDAGTMTINVSNAGTGQLVWDVSSNTPWLETSLTATNTGDGSFEVTIAANESEAGRSGTILVSAEGAEDGQQEISFVQQGASETCESIWEVALSVQSGTGTTSLSFGQAANATNGIDVDCGEAELPPLPPAGIFDVRFDISGSQGALVDLRGDGATEPEWLIKFQPNTTESPMTLKWDPKQLPKGSFTLLDGFGGVVTEINMKKQSQYTHSNFNITSLIIRYTDEVEDPVTVSTGWNMVSVPLQATDMSVEALFPGIVNPTAFAYDSGFVAVSQLEVGKGYWIKFSKQNSFTILGYPVEPKDISLAAGWNIVGPFDEDIAVTDIVASSEGLLVSDFFGFDKGYSTAEVLEKGKGYWVKASGSGTLSLAQNSGSGSAPALSRSPEASWSRLHIEDAAGNSGYVYLADGGDVSEISEQPPVPPAGSFDARFANGKAAASVEGAGASLKLQAAQYPIRITAEQLTTASVRITDEIDGKLVDTFLSSGDVVEISQPLTSLKVMEAAGDVIPTGFKLGQNYPNPFNPTTRISFALPAETTVKITLFNALGAVVREVVNGEFAAGYHEITVDGRRLATGLYFYVLEADNFKDMKKMILAK